MKIFCNANQGLDFLQKCFFANKCAQCFYSTSLIESKGPVYSWASWTFELLYNCVGTWRFLEILNFRQGPQLPQ